MHQVIHLIGVLLRSCTFLSILRPLVMMDDTIKEQRFEQLCDCNPPKGNDENEEQEPTNFQSGNRQSQQ